MNDTDLMPFGIHKGTPMEDVPDDYLIWLESQKWVQRKYPAVYEYVQENWSIISQSIED